MLRFFLLLVFAACRATLPACANPCSNPGDTRCASDAGVQTCVQQSANCTQWGPAQGCASGEVCSGDACIDECQTTAIETACNAAAAEVTSCCGPTLGSGELCHTALLANEDPILYCNNEAVETCDQIHADAKVQNVCCCAAGDTCDYASSDWQCAKKCTQTSDCASETDRESCAPNMDPATSVAFSPYICKPTDATLYDGCSSTQACSSGVCYQDANENDFCATECTVDSDCGNISQACCNLTFALQTPATGMACAPCTLGGGSR